MSAAPVTAPPVIPSESMSQDQKKKMAVSTIAEFFNNETLSDISVVNP